MVVSLGTGLLPPFLVRRIFDHSLPSQDLDELLWLSFAILLFSFASQWFAYGQQVTALKLRNRVRFQLSSDLCRHVLHLPWPYLQSRDTGYWQTRMREDVAAVEHLMTDRLVELFGFGLRAILFFALLFWLDWFLASVGFGWMLVTAIGVLFHTRRMKKLSTVASEQSARTGGFLMELLAGIFTLRLFGTEQKEVGSFEGELDREMETRIQRDSLGLKSWRFIGIMGACGAYLTVAIGAYRILKDQSSIGTLMAFFIFLQRLVGTMRNALNLAPLLAQSAAGLQRVVEIFSVEREVGESIEAPGRRLQGEVEVRELNLQFDDHQTAISALNFKVSAGEVVYLVGPNGAGKTSLMHLLLGLRKPTSGEILFDGQPMERFPLQWLREQVGFVPAEAFLFHRSLRENLLYGNPQANSEQWNQALALAGCTEMLEELPLGLDTMLGERGARLSQGQRQRVALARALLRDPKILIFDEPTANQDPESSARLMRLLPQAAQGRTCFMISHLLPDEEFKGRILVMNRGRLIEEGDYRQLASQGGWFQKNLNVKA